MKGSKGVIGWAIFMLFFAGFVSLASAIYYWASWFEGPPPAWIVVTTITGGLWALISLVCAINILRLKDWARAAIVYTSVFVILALIAVIIFLIGETLKWPDAVWNLLAALCCILPFLLVNSIYLVFFTRPTVKEQFQ